MIEALLYDADSWSGIAVEIGEGACPIVHVAYRLAGGRIVSADPAGVTLHLPTSMGPTPYAVPLAGLTAQQESAAQAALLATIGTKYGFTALPCDLACNELRVLGIPTAWLDGLAAHLPCVCSSLGAVVLATVAPIYERQLLGPMEPHLVEPRDWFAAWKQRQMAAA